MASMASPGPTGYSALLQSNQPIKFFQVFAHSRHKAIWPVSHFLSTACEVPCPAVLALKFGIARSERKTLKIDDPCSSTLPKPLVTALRAAEAVWNEWCDTHARVKFAAKSGLEDSSLDTFTFADRATLRWIGAVLNQHLVEPFRRMFVRRCVGSLQVAAVTIQTVILVMELKVVAVSACPVRCCGHSFLALGNMGSGPTLT